MVINFLVNEIAGGWEPSDTRLGGTEESVVRWAGESAKKGHKVTVYRNGRKEYPFKTLRVDYMGQLFYVEREDYEGGGDICINVKSSHIAPKEPTLYLTNETDATNADLSKYLGVIWPSQWAVDNIPINNNKTFILPHGYDETKINATSPKIKKQCLYASSPDRGLDTLLEVWPIIHKQHPDATLIVTYGVENIDLPGVICLGEVDEDTMYELFNTSEYWLHPCNGGELYCITGIKAQAAGCIPVVIPRMALAETVRHGYFAKDESDYAKVLNEALNGSKNEGIRTKLAKEKYPTWEKSTDILLGMLKSIM